MKERYIGFFQRSMLELDFFESAGELHEKCSERFEMLDDYFCRHLCRFLFISNLLFIGRLFVFHPSVICSIQMSSLRPLVGIAVIAVNPSRYPHSVLVSERLSSHGKGAYQLPGGHLEYGETFEECARRELKEETNLSCSNLKLIYVTNNIFSEEDGGPKHYVTLFMKATIDDDSTLKCLEPEKNSEWIWTEWNDLKDRKLFAPLREAVHDHSFNPFDQASSPYN